MIRVHVRDRHGHHLLDADAHRTAITSIKASVGERLVIQVTSEALGVYAPDRQMQAVRDVRPESVSLALSELVPDEAHEAAFGSFLEWLRTEKVAPQIILYSPDEASYLEALTK